MITKICDICGKVERLAEGKFCTFNSEVGIFFKTSETFHICPECMALIKELREKQINNREVKND